MGSDARVVEVHDGKTVVVDFDSELTFECVDGCTWCCHRGVTLSEADLRALTAHADGAAATTTVAGEPYVRREDKDREDHVSIDGRACYFLDDDGLCALEANHDWKPTRCSVFPLAVTVEPGDLTAREGGDIHVSVREDAKRNCDGLDVSERSVVDNLDAFLPKALWDLDSPEM
jgi:hypothetical protein